MSALDTWRRHIAERPWRAGLYAFAALIVVSLGLFAVDYVLRPESFPVRSVRFEGAFGKVDQKALTDAVMGTVRGNFFLVDLDAVRRRAQLVPWVHDVNVRRSWPDGIDIQFTEQQLVARWGKSLWVNAQGETVDLQGQAGPDGLPQFQGPDGMAARVLDHYRQLSTILSPIELNIAQLALSARHSWTVQLDTGLVLTLGREAPEPKVERFALAYPQSLAARAGQIRRVDLRYTNGFSVEWNGRAGAGRGSNLVTTGLHEG